MSEEFRLQRENDLLKQLISVMNTTTKLDNILNYLLDLMTMVTTSEAAYMLVKDVVEGDFLTVRAVAGLKKSQTIGKEWPMDKGVISQCYLSGNHRICNSPHSEPDFDPAMGKLLGIDIKTLMALPMNADGRLVGAIGVINKKDGMQFSSEDVSFGMILADQAASIVGNETTFKTAEARIKRFNTLMQVSEEINKQNDLHQLLDTIMESAKMVMRAEASSLFLLDEKAQELYIESAQGDAGEQIKQFRLPVGKGIAGWVAQKGKPQLIPDAYKDDRFNPEFDKKTGFRTRSIVCVPMFFKKKNVGVIQIINALDKEEFEEDDVPYMMALAGQAAIAIENVRLLQSNKELFLNVVMALVKMIDSRHSFYNGHSLRVAKYAVAIAKQLGVPKDTIEKVQVCAFLHDIGRTQVPDFIIAKKGQLTEQEWAVIKRQPLFGAKFLQGIKMLEYAVPAVLYHMEHYNGKGYPKGVQGEQIPLIARILNVANSFDAMTSPRPYRNPMEKQAARNQVSTKSGSQFDPLIVKAFLAAYDAGQI